MRRSKALVVFAVIGVALLAITPPAEARRKKNVRCTGTAKVWLDEKGAPEKFELIGCKGSCDPNVSECEVRHEFGEEPEPELHKIYDAYCGCKGEQHCGPTLRGGIDDKKDPPALKPADSLSCNGSGCREGEKCWPVIEAKGQKPEVPIDGHFDKSVPLKNGKKGVITVRCECRKEE